MSVSISSVFHLSGRSGDVRRGVKALPKLVMKSERSSSGVLKMLLYSMSQVCLWNLEENSSIDIVGGRKKV